MLVEPVPVLPAEDVGPVHFIAIGGAGMSGIARLFLAHNVTVSGSDQQDSPVLAELAAAGATTYVGHAASQVGHARTVVVSSAIRPDNPELVAARARGLRIWHRSTALASLMIGYDAIGIAGTHGKTTTTAMTATMLAVAGADPSFVVGAPLQSSGQSAHLGGGRPFVVEADESDGSFRQYPTRIAVVTNLEADHLDNWGTPERYRQGFGAYARGPLVEVVVTDADDPGGARLAADLRAEGRRVVTYGESPSADVRLDDLTLVGATASATITAQGLRGRLDLQVPGRHNLHNAAAAYTVGRLLGLDHTLLLEGAASFQGTERRFQTVGEVGDIRIVDDYAHHPTEIAATLRAARAAAGDGRVVACFQPHLFTRTRDFADEFGAALSAADLAVVLDVYPAREDPLPGITGELVADAVTAHGGATLYVPLLADAPAVLAGMLRPGDLLVTLGAGSVTTVGPLVLDLLRHR